LAGANPGKKSRAEAEAATRAMVKELSMEKFS